MYKINNITLGFAHYISLASLLPFFLQLYVSSIIRYFPVPLLVMFCVINYSSDSHNPIVISFTNLWYKMITINREIFKMICVLSALLVLLLSSFCAQSNKAILHNLLVLNIWYDGISNDKVDSNCYNFEIF